MTSDVRLVIGGLKSLIPRLSAPTGTGGTVDPTYCYAVWLRHLRMLARAGVDPSRDNIVELGPGDSIGTGLAALLTTATRYTALDVVPHADAVVQVTLLDAITEMLRQRQPIPDASLFPDLFPRLRAYDFPNDLLSPRMLDARLAPERVAELRLAIERMARDSATSMRYVCPWSATSVENGTADLVFSQAVLQEIDNRGKEGALRQTFRAMSAWLKPGGVMSHQIDLGMYGAEPWDRHWTYADATWSLIRGQRVNYINREPLSTYERLARETGFDVVLLDVVHHEPTTPTRELAGRFRSLDERDRTARAVHMVAVRRA
jgi:hypothetical protein